MIRYFTSLGRNKEGLGTWLLDLLDTSLDIYINLDLGDLRKDISLLRDVAYQNSNPNLGILLGGLTKILQTCNKGHMPGWFNFIYELLSEQRYQATPPSYSIFNLYKA